MSVVAGGAALLVAAVPASGSSVVNTAAVATNPEVVTGTVVASGNDPSVGRWNLIRAVSNQGVCLGLQLPDVYSDLPPSTEPPLDALGSGIGGKPLDALGVSARPPIDASCQIDPELQIASWQQGTNAVVFGSTGLPDARSVTLQGSALPTVTTDLIPGSPNNGERYFFKLLAAPLTQTTASITNLQGGTLASREVPYMDLDPDAPANDATATVNDVIGTAAPGFDGWCHFEGQFSFSSGPPELSFTELAGNLSGTGRCGGELDGRRFLDENATLSLSSTGLNTGNEKFSCVLPGGVTVWNMARGLPWGGTLTLQGRWLGIEATVITGRGTTPADVHEGTSGSLFLQSMSTGHAVGSFEASLSTGLCPNETYNFDTQFLTLSALRD